MGLTRMLGWALRSRGSPAHAVPRPGLLLLFWLQLPHQHIIKAAAAFYGAGRR